MVHWKTTHWGKLKIVQTNINIFCTHGLEEESIWLNDHKTHTNSGLMWCLLKWMAFFTDIEQRMLKFVKLQKTRTDKKYFEEKKTKLEVP